MLYSVSLNGQDDRGAFSVAGNGTIGWDKLDAPFLLDGVHPRPGVLTVIRPDELSAGDLDAGQDPSDDEDPTP